MSDLFLLIEAQMARISPYFLLPHGCRASITATKSRKQPLDYDKALYRQRHKVENLFAKLKDWRRIAPRYDRCAHTFFSAIRLAAAVAFYLNQ